MLFLSFFSIVVFLSLSQCFSSFSCYIKQFLRGLHLFWQFLFFAFKESTLQYFKKIQVQIIVFNKKLLWKFLGKFVESSVLNFLVWLWIDGKTIETPGFYDITHCSIISLRLDVSSLTEIQYLSIEPNEYGMHTDESMMLKNFLSVRIRQMNKVHLMGYKNNYLIYLLKKIFVHL